MSEEQTIISPPPAAPEAERTQIAIAPGTDVTQAAVVIQCPVCHTANPPGDRWCQDCGFLLSSPAPEVEEMPAVSGPRLVLDGREFGLRAGDNTIGRANADVLLPDPTVSRHHATLAMTEEGAWIEDVGSTNGTFLNGTPATSGSRSPLQDGDTLKFGSVTVKLVWPEGADLRPPVVDSSTAEAGSEAAVAQLVAADGRELALRAGVTSMGRRAENAIVVSGDAYVSGRHAEIRCEQTGCVLVDLGSTNGTFHRVGPLAEWERLAAHEPRPLSPGDELRLGQSSFTFQAAPAAAEEGAETVGEPQAPAPVEAETVLEEAALPTAREPEDQP